MQLAIGPNDPFTVYSVFSFTPASVHVLAGSSVFGGVVLFSDSKLFVQASNGKFLAFQLTGPAFASPVPKMLLKVTRDSSGEVKVKLTGQPVVSLGNLAEPFLLDRAGFSVMYPASDSHLYAVQTFDKLVADDSVEEVALLGVLKSQFGVSF